MKSTSHAFKDNARVALGDEGLQDALGKIRYGFVANRAKARANLPEFEELRDQARAIKEHTLAHLDLYLEEYEAKVIELGGQVHWAPTAGDARDTILRICQDSGARSIV